ncbi:MAG: hypothetical protein J6O88_14770 [Chryseobacterium sp.]|uniref:hypothetical protein n=1 Tax=Chryseobacterium sp. TaxID=1871047 RepID=UPI001AFEFAD2|nr:hypothetical protein [Chryseobacterium sp.]MBO6185921.1 hypothetical protein [Chryseobacterium sp.]
MSKKGVSKISGNPSPKVGEAVTYTVTDWYPSTPQNQRNPANVIWELFKKRPNGRFTSTNIKKTGVGNFTFGEVAQKHTYRLEAYLFEPEGRGASTIEINPQPAAVPKIEKVELQYVDDSPGTVFRFTEKMRARAQCVNLNGKKLKFTLWEDDATGEGHNAKNLLIETKEAAVDRSGVATAEFMLTRALMQKAMQGETDPKQLEFYVTVEYFSHKKHATDNVNVNNPFPPINGEIREDKTQTVPKAKDSPAASKPASKKEEKGILDQVSDWWKDFDLWDWGESGGTVKKEQPPTVQKSEGKSVSIVKGEKKPTSSCICKEQYKDLIWGGKVSCEFRKKVILISRRNSIDPNNLMAAMAHETGGTFDPTIGTFKKHKDESREGYVGLLQIGKDAATDLKITRTKLLNMNQIEQLDYVEKYLNLPLVKGKLNTLTDFYLAVLFPVDCGKGNQPNHVVFDNSLPISYKNGKAIRNLNYWRNVGYSANPAFHKEKKEQGKTYIWEIAENIKIWYDNGKNYTTKEFSCQDVKATPKQNEASGKIVYFDSGLTEERVNVVSQFTISLLEKAAKNSANDKLIITSTIRSTRKQAEVMYSNESSGNHIRYAAPGRAVIAVFNTGKSRSDSKEKIISDMDKKIKELSESGQRVSLHCVSKEAYSKNNIIDISYSRGAKNPRDLIRELVKDPAVTKIIHPLNNVVSNSKVKYDTKEPAIHVEIKVQ